MRAPEVVTVDFETEGIEDRPAYPPKPVGVAITEPGKQPRYLAWGHPEGNNCSRADAIKALTPLWKRAAAQRGPQLLFHNAKFDLDVAEVHLGLKLPPWSGFHDTLFLLFLDDPHALTLSLKPAAERYLKLKPTERDAVRAWLVDHDVCRKNDSRWGRFISKAPGDIVGKYAVGDVVRTERLFKKLYGLVCVKRKMQEPYDRERKLLPILLDNERLGIRVNLTKLRADVKIYTVAIERIDKVIRSKLKAPGLNVDSDAELADALDKTDFVDHGAWLATPTGKRSTAKDSLAQALTDAPLRELLRYRSIVATCLRTFMSTWLQQAEQTNGFVHTTWNQVRQGHDAGGLVGARTGRLSSSPNFQNVPVVVKDEQSDKPLPPPSLVRGLPPYPTMREYFLPDRGGHWLKRDYSQQEFRLLAHYEDGPLLAAYQRDPKMDVHDTARDLINGLLNTTFSRKPIKNTGFGLIYGMGKAKLAKKSGTDIEQAMRVKRAYLSTFPGIETLNRELRRRAASDEPIRTWGGREYYVEPPKMIDGELRSFEYKLLNQLIQGGAADCTKEAVVRYHEVPRREGRLLLTVHDELDASSPQGCWREEMERLRAAMESLELDVPMLSDGTHSRINWQEAQ